MKGLKISFRVLLFVIVTTLLIWPCIACMYDPKGETVGWWMFTIVIEGLSVFAWIMFGNPEK
jgi:hypothetical protein